LVINPQGRHYDALKRALAIVYEDNYWIEDAVFMERNSRDFAPRVKKMNRNAELLCDYLRSRSIAGSSASGSVSTETYVIKDIYYPKWVTCENYDACRIGSKEQISRSASRSGGTHTKEDVPEGGYGMLFTITFMSEYASEVFYDALPTEKGPSLGTNFTLASPYAILAHYNELEWAAEYGVERSLVRVSVGLEDENELLSWFQEALRKAEQAVNGNCKRL
jgi:cystathionine gamma-synthase